MLKKVIFLDRDGVINKEIGYLHKVDDFVFIPGVFEALKYLRSLGYHLIVVTNQSGISRGYYSIEDFEILNNWMINKFLKNDIEILDVFYCPHHPDELCDCRKPKSGLIVEAKKKYLIDLTSSWMIGDTEKDIEAGISAGIKNNILVRSGHTINEKTTKTNIIINSIKDITRVITS